MKEGYWLFTDKTKVLQRHFTGKHLHVVFKELEIGSDFLNPKINWIKSKLPHSNYVYETVQHHNCREILVFELHVET